MNFGKILLFNGSPRKTGYTTKLLNEIGLSAQKAGSEVKEYNLCHPEVRGCQGCFYCRTNEGCPVRDPLHSMYEEIKTATGIVFGSPVYFYQISGQAKQGLDRMYPMLGMKDSKLTPRYPGKKVVTVFTQGNPDKEAFSACIQSTNTLFAAFGWTVIDSLVCAGTAQSNVPGLEGVFEDARKLGIALSK